MDNTPEDEQKLNRVRKALKGRFDRIDSFNETNIRKGTGITSFYTLNPSGAVFSKCFKPELYKDAFQAYVIDDDDDNYDEAVSEKYDKKRDLFKNEENIIRGLNQISEMPVEKLYPNIDPEVLSKDEAFKEKIKLAPQLYGSIPEEERVLMEKLEPNFYKQEFIEIDNKLSFLYEKSKTDGLNNSIMNKISSLEKEKSGLRSEGLYYLARFHHLCNENSGLFDAKPRRKYEEVERKKSYLEDMLMAFHEEDGFSKEELQKYLNSKKGISLNEIAAKMHDIKKAYFEKYKCNIHGDLAVDHLNPGGTFIDFDEFRQDLPQDDLVRFLNNEFSAFFQDYQRDIDEGNMPFYIADYFVDRKRLEGKINWNDKYKLGNRLDAGIALISDKGMNEEFRDFLTAYYFERIEEDVHIFSINKRVGDERLKVFAEGHPLLNRKEDFQQFRIDDIDRVLSILLRDGREKILKDPKGQKDTTLFFEDMRKIFEKGGILKGDSRFGELNLDL